MRYDGRVREDSGAEPETTNNRMELRAVIEALSFIVSRRKAVLSSINASAGKRKAGEPEWLSAPIQIFTDSQYVRLGITKWLQSWKRRNWLTADKKPIKNRTQWEELDLLTAKTEAEFHWVAGHSGIDDNERCDTLVRMRIDEMHLSVPRK
jgi:ribonuclease HI